MALIAFPAVPLTEVNCELIWPGQRIHESIYTGSQQAISRGVGRWSGTFVWAARSRSQQADDIAAIDAFFALAEGAVNTFDLPVPVSTAQVASIPADADVRVTAAERVGSQVGATVNRMTGGLALGDRVTVDGLLFQVTSSLAEGRCFLSPWRPLEIPTAGLAIDWQTPTVRARLTSSSPVSVRRDIDWAGPWSASFVASD